ncbi:hypothetical protein ACLESD_02685 [Pyxidicoccus sp. 3LFB2]
MSVVSIFGVGCGGGEVPEGAADVSEQPGQVSAELVKPCSDVIGKVCRPESVIGCVMPDGAFAECFCQQVPSNKWVCLAD